MRHLKKNPSVGEWIAIGVAGAAALFGAYKLFWPKSIPKNEPSNLKISKVTNVNTGQSASPPNVILVNNGDQLDVELTWDYAGDPISGSYVLDIGEIIRHALGVDSYDVYSEVKQTFNKQGGDSVAHYKDVVSIIFSGDTSVSLSFWPPYVIIKNVPEGKHGLWYAIADMNISGKVIRSQYYPDCLNYVGGAAEGLDWHPTKDTALTVAPAQAKIGDTVALSVGLRSKLPTGGNGTQAIVTCQVKYTALIGSGDNAGPLLTQQVTVPAGGTKTVTFNHIVPAGDLGKRDVFIDVNWGTDGHLGNAYADAFEVISGGTVTQGSLVSSRDPADAVFIVGGYTVPVTETRTNLDPGNYDWSCSKAGYISQTGQIAIVAGEVTPLAITLVPEGAAQGTLELLSLSPADAVFTVGGVQFGVGSHPINAGVYDWVCSKAGYVTDNGTVTIVAGQNTPMSVTLAPVSTQGVLALTISPSDADFAAETVLMVSGNHNLSPGVYDWNCAKTGYISQMGSFTIVTGQTTTLNVTLVAAPQGTLALTLSPSDAVFTIGGVQKTGGNILLTPGTYDWSCSKTGYVTKTGSVTIVASQTITLSVTLSPTVTTGVLVVSVSPSGAELYAEGVLMTNGSHNLTPGTYSWACAKDGYTSQTGHFTITLGQTTTLNVTLVLAPVTGNLNIIYSPPDATFALNGETKIPGFYTLSPGNYSWSCSRSGYTTKTGTVTVVANQTVTVNVTLSAGTGNLALTLSPSDAAFYLEGVRKYAGTFALAPGTYGWECSKNGYTTRTGTVTITAGNTATLNVTLVATPSGTLNLSLSPSGGTFIIGGVVMTAGSHTIDPGTYDWSFSKSGYISQTGTVTIVAGQTRTLSLTLSAQVDYGVLGLAVSPSGASFTAEGMLMNNGSHMLDPGVYSWVCTKTGYVTQSGTFTIVAGQTTALNITLQAEGGGTLGWLIRWTDGSTSCVSIALAQSYIQYGYASYVSDCYY